MDLILNVIQLKARSASGHCAAPRAWSFSWHHRGSVGTWPRRALLGGILGATLTCGCSQTSRRRLRALVAHGVQPRGHWLVVVLKFCSAALALYRLGCPELTWLPGVTGGTRGGQGQPALLTGMVLNAAATGIFSRQEKSSPGPANLPQDHTPVSLHEVAQIKTVTSSCFADV